MRLALNGPDRLCRLCLIRPIQPSRMRWHDYRCRDCRGAFRRAAYTLRREQERCSRRLRDRRWYQRHRSMKIAQMHAYQHRPEIQEHHRYYERSRATAARLAEGHF